MKILLAEFCEEQIAELKAECDLAIEGRDIKINELEAENEQIKNSDTLCKLIGEQKRKIAELEEQIEKMKRCEICKHQSSISGCSYHSISVKDCKENGMKLFELKEITEK